MLTLKRFTGINNVTPPERLEPSTREQSTPLAEALNVDVGNDRELLRRQGFAQASSVCHKNVWEGEGFTLATTNGGDLVSIVGDSVTVVAASLGASRVWYANWADGRTAFSNGAIAGIVTAGGASSTPWGVPLPETVGTGQQVAGGLFAGTYRWAIAYQRLSDLLVGGLEYSSPLDLGADAGLSLTGLPQLAGYRIKVYLTSHNGAVARLAGSTDTDSFTFSGANTDLVLEAETDHVYPAPVGTVHAQWRGRSLIGQGSALWASLYLRPEHFKLSDDFKVMRGNITMIQPVESGVFVGTDQELCFLRGDQWGTLAYRPLLSRPVVRGSGVTVPGEYLKRADGTAGAGACMLAICGGHIVAGYPDGDAAVLTKDVYRTDAQEVAAAFRLRPGSEIPQYVAIAQ